MASELTGPLAPTGSGALATVPPGYPPPDALPPLEEQEGGIPWERFIAAIKRYKWLVVSVARGRERPERARLPLREAGVLGHERRSTSRSRHGQRARSAPRNCCSRCSGWNCCAPTPCSTRWWSGRRCSSRPASPRDSLLIKGFSLSQNRFRPGTYEVERDGKSGEYRLLLPDGTVASRAAAGDSLGREMGFRWVPATGGARAGREGRDPGPLAARRVGPAAREHARDDGRQRQLHAGVAHRPGPACG